MKKSVLLFLFAGFFIVFSQRSSAQNSNIVFYTQGSEPFFVFFNGVKQNQNPGNNVKIFAVDNDKLNVLIVIPHPVFAMVNNAIRIIPNKESVYSIAKNFKGDYELSFKGENAVSLTQSSPGQLIIKYHSHLPLVQGVAGGIGPGGGFGPGHHDPGTNFNTTTTTTIISGNQGMPVPTNYLPGYNGPIGCPVPMTFQEFQGAKNSISSKPFESSKIAVAKQVAGSNCLFASQVKEVMTLFSFEGTKIEFAKFAYTHTYDKGNFFIVNDAFDFDSSIHELNKFIGK